MASRGVRATQTFSTHAAKVYMNADEASKGFLGFWSRWQD